MGSNVAGRRSFAAHADGSAHKCQNMGRHDNGCLQNTQPERSLRRSSAWCGRFARCNTVWTACTETNLPTPLPAFISVCFVSKIWPVAKPFGRPPSSVSHCVPSSYWTLSRPPPRADDVRRSGACARLNQMIASLTNGIFCALAAP